MPAQDNNDNNDNNDRNDRQPWTPRIDTKPLFLSSADLERRLGEANDPVVPQLDCADEVPVDEAAAPAPGEQGAPAGNNPVIKPTV